MSIEVNHRELEMQIRQCYGKRVPLFVHGRTGIGKTETLRKVAKELDIKVIDRRLSEMDPVDLLGTPYPDGDLTRWRPPSWLPREGKGILFFDEYNLADEMLQKATWQLIHDRECGEYQLPDGWVAMGAGNVAEDKSGINSMSPPLNNRMSHVTLVGATYDEYERWMYNHHIDSKIIGCLRAHPNLMYRFSDKTDAFPTYRSWAMASHLIDGVDDLDTVRQFVASVVGEGAAAELIAFVRLAEEVDIENLYRNPKDVKNIPEERLDLKYSVLSKMAEDARSRSVKVDTVLRVIKQMEAEFAVLGLRMMKAAVKKRLAKSKLWYEDLSKRYEKYLVE